MLTLIAHAIRIHTITTYGTGHWHHIVKGFRCYVMAL